MRANLLQIHGYFNLERYIPQLSKKDLQMTRVQTGLLSEQEHSALF